MNDSFRREFYWPNMVSDVYKVFNKRTGDRRMGIRFNYQRKLDLFTPAGHLDFVAINSLGPLSRTKADNQFFVIITDGYTKLTAAIRTKKRSLTKVAKSSLKTR